MPNELVIAGDQPFFTRLIGFLLSLMVCCIYNMGVGQGCCGKGKGGGSPQAIVSLPG